MSFQRNIFSHFVISLRTACLFIRQIGRQQCYCNGTGSMTAPCVWSWLKAFRIIWKLGSHKVSISSWVFCICMDVYHVGTKHRITPYNVDQYLFIWITKLIGYFLCHACVMETIRELTVIPDRPRLRYITRGRALNYWYVTFKFFKLLCDTNIIYFENKVLHGEYFFLLVFNHKNMSIKIHWLWLRPASHIIWDSDVFNVKTNI